MLAHHLEVTCGAGTVFQFFKVLAAVSVKVIVANGFGEVIQCPAMAAGF